MDTPKLKEQATPRHQLEELDAVTIRFAGDSGDGMQLTGTQFTATSAIIGNDISTLPDFPAEIRAPAGSLPGVSGYQLNFSSHDIRTPGDEPNVLVAMNPAALKMNLKDLEPGGILVVNTDAFVESNLRKAGYETNPLEDGSLSGYRVFKLPITSLTIGALEEAKLPHKQMERCKNFYALGLMYWLFDRPLEPTLKWIDQKFSKMPEVALANKLAVKAGYNYAETTEIFTTHYRVAKSDIKPGKYRNITGNEATAIGFIAASQLAGRPLYYGSYPITPASDILHELSVHKNFGVKTFQAEDEIAAVGAAVGAAFAGNLGLTGTSGPGLALKSEFIGLAVMTELPIVIIDVQRGGPSTGLPTKTEQADLLQAMFGRNSECPVAVVAPATPSECFSMAIEAFRIAIKYMTPVVYLSDGYLGNGSEPWEIPSIESLPRIEVKFRTEKAGFYPYLRDERTLARPWAIPGTPGLEHRIGGLEKQHITGNVNYDPDNHDFMVRLRAEKVARIAQDIPLIEVSGEPEGKVLVLGWGSTHGAITTATEQLRAKGASVSSAHLRYLNPFPRNLGEVLSRFETVIVPELNLGQLALLVRARFLVDAISFSKVKGLPFKVSEIVKKINEYL
ncbi:MAG: Pyruvate:ferredoxin oxidoreductase-like 2-oxoacid:ferredoxin oxidoreductase, alpha subunit [candidate division NC10 bacterium]|nr:Pyruvate:ferredoxin oxidoreductase-like 2-oxoacid:ferredoxin oxidoreductase, alpha subunit [candidate division NC10 bacterium]